MKSLLPYLLLVVLVASSFLCSSYASGQPALKKVTASVSAAILLDAGIAAAAAAVSDDDDCTATMFLPMSKCSELRAIALNTSSNGTLFVACSDAVLSVDVHGNVTQLTAPKQCYGATALAYDRTRNILYASCESGVAAISAPGVFRIVISVDQCGGATSVYVDEASGTVYSGCNENNQGIMAALPNGKVEQAVSYQDCPLAVGLTGASGVMYAACNNNGGVIAVAADWTVSTFLSNQQCPYPNVVKFDQSSGLVYVSCWSGEVAFFSVDPASATSTALLDTSACQTVNFAVDSPQGIAYVSCTNTFNTLISLNMQSGVTTPISEITELAAVGMTFDLSSNTLYFAETSEDLMAVQCPPSPPPSGVKVLTQ